MKRRNEFIQNWNGLNTKDLVGSGILEVLTNKEIDKQFFATFTPILRSCLKTILMNDPDINPDRIETVVLIALFTMTLVMDVGGHPEQAERAVIQVCKELPSACKVAIESNQDIKSPQKKLETIVQTTILIIRRIIEKMLPELTHEKREVVGRSLQRLLTLYTFFPEDKELKGSGVIKGGGDIPDNPFNTEWISGQPEGFYSGTGRIKSSRQLRGRGFGGLGVLLHNAWNWFTGSNDTEEPLPGAEDVDWTTVDNGDANMPDFSNVTPKSGIDWASALKDTATQTAKDAAGSWYNTWNPITSTICKVGLPVALKLGLNLAGDIAGDLYNVTLRKYADTAGKWDVDKQDHLVDAAKENPIVRNWYTLNGALSRVAKFADDHVAKHIRNQLYGEDGERRRDALGSYLSQAVPYITQDIAQQEAAVRKYNAQVKQRQEMREYKEKQANARYNEALRQVAQKNDEIDRINANMIAQNQDQINAIRQKNQDMLTRYYDDVDYWEDLSQYNQDVNDYTYNTQVQLQQWKDCWADFERRHDVKALGNKRTEAMVGLCYRGVMDTVNTAVDALPLIAAASTAGLVELPAGVAAVVDGLSGLSQTQNKLQAAINSGNKAQISQLGPQFFNQYNNLNSQLGIIQSQLGHFTNGQAQQVANNLQVGFYDPYKAEALGKELAVVNNSVNQLQKTLKTNGSNFDGGILMGSVRKTINGVDNLFSNIGDSAVKFRDLGLKKEYLQDIIDNDYLSTTPMPGYDPSTRTYKAPPVKPIKRPEWVGQQALPSSITDDPNRLYKHIRDPGKDLFAATPFTDLDPTAPVQGWANTNMYLSRALPAFNEAWKHKEKPKEKPKDELHTNESVTKVTSGPTTPNTGHALKTSVRWGVPASEIAKKKEVVGIKPIQGTTLNNAIPQTAVMPSISVPGMNGVTTTPLPSAALDMSKSMPGVNLQMFSSTPGSTSALPFGMDPNMNPFPGFDFGSSEKKKKSKSKKTKAKKAKSSKSKKDTFSF